MKIGVFDCEADGIEATLLWCGVVKELDKEDVWTYGPDSIHDFLIHLGSFDVVIGHNIIEYDLPTLKRLYGFEFKGKVVDTVVMSRLQRPNRTVPFGCRSRGPHSLESWGWRLGHHKPVHEDWSQFSPEMLHRCKEDVLITEEVFHALQEEGRGEGWAPAHKLNMELFTYLQRQQEYGWKVDLDHIDHCIALLDRWISIVDRAVVHKLPPVIEIQEQKIKGMYNCVKKPFKKDGSYSQVTERFLEAIGKPNEKLVVGPFSRICLRPVDLDKAVEVKHVLLSLGWIPSEWNVDKHGEDTSPKLSKNDEFEGLSGGMGKLIVRRVQCKQRRGILEGWKKSIRPDGRIGASYSGLATTGRLKHSGIVNVPSHKSGSFFGKHMRQVFVASPGMVMVGTDSKENQVRQLCARMGDDEFTHAVLHGKKEDGTDHHTLTQKKINAPTRTHAKNFFYGIIFGAGDEKAGKLVGQGGARAGKAAKLALFKNLPKIGELVTRLEEEWNESAEQYYNPERGQMELRNGWITGLDGRRVTVASPHAALVYLLQSDEAIQMAAAYCWLNRELDKRYTFGKDFGFLIWYHDEWQLECKPEIVQDVVTLSNRAISWAAEHYKIPCPHEGESLVGFNWYETH